MPDVTIETKSYKKSQTDFTAIRQPLVPPTSNFDKGKVLSNDDGSVKFGNSAFVVNFVIAPDNQERYMCDKSVDDIIENAKYKPVIGIMHEENGGKRYLTYTQTSGSDAASTCRFEGLWHTGAAIEGVTFIVMNSLCIKLEITPSYFLPSFTAADAGKFLAISSTGEPCWELPSST